MEIQEIKGKLVWLRPLTREDIEKFYQWATNSDATRFWYDELYGDVIPDRETFFKDWTDAYFVDIAPERKQGFVICVHETNQEIGRINYQVDEDEQYKTVLDLDIIIVAVRLFSPY